MVCETAAQSTLSRLGSPCRALLPGRAIEALGHVGVAQQFDRQTRSPRPDCKPPACQAVVPVCLVLNWQTGLQNAKAP
jgi:hypothetical protein